MLIIYYYYIIFIIIYDTWISAVKHKIKQCHKPPDPAVFVCKAPEAITFNMEGFLSIPENRDKQTGIQTDKQIAQALGPDRAEYEHVLARIARPVS